MTDEEDDLSGAVLSMKVNYFWNNFVVTCRDMGCALEYIGGGCLWEVEYGFWEINPWLRLVGVFSSSGILAVSGISLPLTKYCKICQIL